MLDKQFQGQNPLLGLLTGAGSNTQPVAKAQEATEDQTLDFKQVLEDERRSDRAEDAGELNPLEDVGTETEGNLDFAAQQADENQAKLENAASLSNEAGLGASSVAAAQELFVAQALPASVDFTSASDELATTTLEGTSELIPLGERSAGVLDPTNSGTTVLNSESVQRLNLLREQNGAPQLSVGTQSNAAAPASEPTFPVLFPAQDSSVENLGVIPTEETPTAKSVLEAQTNVAAEQSLDAQLVANAGSTEQVAASAAAELPEQVVQEGGAATDRLGSQAATEELTPSSQNVAGLEDSTLVKPSGEAKVTEVVSGNTLPNVNSSGQAQSNELNAAEQLASEFSEESLESDTEAEGNQLDGESKPQDIPELETRESVESTSSVEASEQR
ncbi:MAG: hypothetical protein AAF394_14965, partial [Planctomycetota bacterium]